MFTLIANVLVLLINCLVLCIIFPQISAEKHLKTEPIPSQLKKSYNLAICFLCFRIAAWTLLILFVLTRYMTIAYMFYICWFPSVIIWLIFQVSKLHNIFVNTQWKLTQCTISWLIFLLIIITICYITGIACLLWYLNSVGSTYILTIHTRNYETTKFELRLFDTSIVLVLAHYIMVLILIIHVSYLFCNKLLMLTVTIRASLHRDRARMSCGKLVPVNIYIDNNDLTNKQKNMLNLIAKQTFLNFCQSLWAIIVAFTPRVWGYGSNGDEVDAVCFIIWVSLAVIFETLFVVSLWFSFAFAQKQYDVACKCCHQLFLSLCERLAVRKINKQLSSTDSQDDNINDFDYVTMDPI